MYKPILTEEAIKNRAKSIRELIKQEFGFDVPHGQCLKIVSQLFGFKNWNTAKATVVRAPDAQSSEYCPTNIKTVGELKRALESYGDSDRIRAYDFIDVEPDYEGGGYWSGPAGTLKRIYSLAVRCEVEGSVEIGLDLEDDEWV